MAEQAEGLSQFPFRECIGGEAAVHKCQSWSEIGIGKVLIEAAQLSAGEHSLINDVLWWQRADIEGIDAERQDSAFDALSHFIKLCLKRNGFSSFRSGGEWRHWRYKYLAYVGHHFACCHTRYIFVDGHVSQMHQFQTITFDLLNHDVQNLVLQLLFSRKKHQASSVTPLFGHRNALQENKLVRNLHHNASTVTWNKKHPQYFSADPLHVLQHAQGIIHQLMTFASMYVYHHTHAARIVLVGWGIQSLFCVHIIMFGWYL